MDNLMINAVITDLLHLYVTGRTLTFEVSPEPRVNFFFFFVEGIFFDNL